jgi:hypothetical protein
MLLVYCPYIPLICHWYTIPLLYCSPFYDTRLYCMFIAMTAIWSQYCDKGRASVSQCQAKWSLHAWTSLHILRCIRAAAAIEHQVEYLCTGSSLERALKFVDNAVFQSPHYTSCVWNIASAKYFNALLRWTISSAYIGCVRLLVQTI